MNFAQALVERGLPRHIAQAFEANARDESGLRTDINEIKPVVPGSRGGYGLLQWTGPRRRQLEAFAQQTGRPVSDMGVQVDFLINELNGTEKRAAKRIMATDNAADAAVVIMNDFLRPHKSHRPKREARYRQMFGGDDVLEGGAEGDTLGAALQSGAVSQDQLLQEAIRRGLIDKSALQAEAERRGLTNQQMQPDPRDRADVENALIQLDQEEGGLPQKGLVEGVGDELLSGVAAGFGDELEAIERAFPALFNDERFREQYQIALSEEREKTANFAEENQALATGANFIGAVATPVGMARRGITLLKGAASTGKAAVRGAAEGSLYGAVWGAGAAEGEIAEVIDQAIKSGAMAAALGGVLTGGLQSISNRAARAQVTKALKPTADLKAARDDAYQAVSSLGASYRSQAVDDMVSRMERGLKSKAFNPELHKGASAAIQYAKTMQGKPATLTELDQLRQVVSRDAGTSNLPADKMFAAQMIDEIDSFIERTVPRGSGQGASTRRVSRAIKSARTAHSQFRKAELIDNILLEAADQAGSTGSGGNVNNIIRQKFKSLLKNKKQIKFFSEAERGAMRRIVRGSAKDNILRLIGKLSPGGNGLMTALNLGAVAVNPAMVGVSAVSGLAKSAADKGTARAVDGLRTTVQSGTNSATAQGVPRNESRALLRALAAEMGVEITIDDPAQ